MRTGFGGSRRRPAVKAGEQLCFPGLASSELPDPKAVVGQGSDPLVPPTYPDTEPVIFKEEGGEPSPFQKAQLDDQRARIDRIVVENEIKRGGIRDRDERRRAKLRERRRKRKAKERDQDERRESELETERWERLDRRVERYVFLAICLLSALAAIVLAFIALPSDQVELKISPSIPVIVSILAGLRLRAVTRGDRTSIWDWLIRRQERE